MFHNFLANTRLSPGVDGAITPPFSSEGLLAYYTMSESSGTRKDKTANGLDLEVETGSVPSTTGIQGDAASFNGSSNLLIQTPNAFDALPSGDFTLTAWVKSSLASPAGNETIFGKGAGAVPHNEFSIRLLGTPTGAFAMMFYANGTYVTADSGLVPVQNQWYFVVGTHAVSTKTIELIINNGTPDSAVYTGVPHTSLRPFRIGWFTAGFWSGLIDEVSIWTRILSVGEITSMYNDGLGKTIPNIP